VTLADDFTSGKPFLDGIAREFVRRRKAIRRGGELYIELLPQEPDDAERCLAVRFVPRGTQPALIVEALERNRLNLYLRRTWSARRGKMLLRIEDLRVVDNPRRIVEAFEWTLAATYRSDPLDGFDETVVPEIEERWRLLALRSL
jgi:hypothetical protein